VEDHQEEEQLVDRLEDHEEDLVKWDLVKREMVEEQN
jgi:hypothetical protein